MAHVTCKAYLTVNTDRLPKYNQHYVITDGHSEIPMNIEAPAKEEQEKKSLNARVDGT